MNLERLLYRGALAHLLGVSAAGHGKLPRAFVDALVDVEEKIDPALWEINSRRAEARALGRKGRPR